jgi:hypothetical protein
LVKVHAQGSALVIRPAQAPASGGLGPDLRAASPANLPRVRATLAAAAALRLLLTRHAPAGVGQITAAARARARRLLRS